MAATATKDEEVSELWFEEYLLERGIGGGDDHHPDLGASRQPDYRIHSGTDTAICEVKEFKSSKADERFAVAPRQPFLQTRAAC